MDELNITTASNINTPGKVDLVRIGVDPITHIMYGVYIDGSGDRQVMTFPTNRGDNVTDTFANGDLIAGVLTINHGLDTRMLLIVVYDNNGIEASCQKTIIDNDNVSLTFGAPIAGTWTYYVKPI